MRGGRDHDDLRAMSLAPGTGTRSFGTLCGIPPSLPGLREAQVHL